MATSTSLPTPAPEEPERWVRTHLRDLASTPPAASPLLHGGQRAADAALAAFDVTGYAANRNQVLPPSDRGASMLSPYIRHGLLPLRRVWDAVAGGPVKDVRKYRDELLWQEYARHVYARLGHTTARALRAQPHRAPDAPADPWRAVEGMACMQFLSDSLRRDGWLVNQMRMWAASHWTVRHGQAWQEGEDAMFRHLLDGSRAANRLGWQWTVGAGTGKPYGFSRWQVRRRAASLCRGCALADDCPIEAWPPDRSLPRVDDPDPRLRHDPDVGGTAGPAVVEAAGSPQVVWLTAESLGDDDPALSANPDLPAVFVFDEPLLRRLRLSGPRLVFLAQTLADLSQRRDLRVHQGAPVAILAGQAVAVTHAPVPGFRRRAASIGPVQTHPWPWLVPPHDGSIRSYSAWRKQARTPRGGRGG